MRQDAAPTEASAPPAVPTSRRRRWRSPGLVLVTLMTPALVGLVGLAGYGLLSTEPGTQWLLRQVPGLVLDTPQGSLLGDFSAQRLSITLPGSRDRITVDALHWQGLTLAWNRSAALWADIHLGQLSARQVRVDLVPSDTPTVAPKDLKIPVGLAVDQLKLDTLLIPSLSEQAITGLRGALSLSTEGGARHMLRIDQLHWDKLRVRGELLQDSDEGLRTQARFQLKPWSGPSSAANAAEANAATALPDWTAQLTAQGSLPQLQLKAQLHSREQSLLAESELQPFADQVLRSLKVRTQALDLAALWSAGPRTALSGELLLHPAPTATGKAAGPQPLMQVQARLRNTQAGRWDQGALPLRELELDLNLRPGDPASLRLRSLDLQLGSASQPAGRLRATGQSATHSGSALSITLDDLRSEHLDARLQSLQAQGSVKLQTDKTVNQLDTQELPPLQLQADLQGRWSQGAISTPLQLQVQAEAGANGLNIRQFRLSADQAAELSLQGQWQRSKSQPRTWTLEGQAQLQAADLRRLLVPPPQFDAKLWQQQAQALQAHAQLKLAGGGAGQMPQGVASSARSRPLQDLPQGQVQVQLQSPSLLGLPLTAELSYQSRGAALPSSSDAALPALPLSSQPSAAQPPAAALAPKLDLHLQSGEQQLDAQLAWQDGRRWAAELKLQAPQLHALQPMFALLAPGSRVQGALHGQGRWVSEPQPGQGLAQWSSMPWQTQGQWQIQQLQWHAGTSATALQLGQMRLNWDLRSHAEAQQALQLSFDQLQLGSSQLARGQMQWQGRWAEHEILARADAKLPIPATWLGEDTLGPQAQGNMALQLRGALSDSPLRAWADGGQWQVRDLQLTAQPLAATTKPRGSASALPKTGSAGTPAASSRPAEAANAWLRLTQARPLIRWAAQGQALRADLPAGRLQALGATLSWADASWRAAEPGTPQSLPDLKLDLRLHPLPVAPVLARLQLDFGWGGDLQVQGSLQLRTRPQLQVDAVLERSQGDLHVTEDLGIQRLGLSELRLGLIGSPGVWHFSHALAGSQIGALAGAVTARHDPSRHLPDADASLQGVLEAQVANLGTWGAWVPTGWRLGGSLFASASYGGQLNAPQINGQAGAKDLSLRNTLLGVDWREGDMSIEFKGSQAQLKQLRAKGGDGELTLQGQLQLGARPEARLQAEARQFRLLRRVDRRLTVSGQMAMQFGHQLRDVQGRLRVDEGLLDFSKGDAPTLGDDVEIVRPQSTAQPEAKPPATPLQLRLAIDMGEKLRLKGYGIDTLLRGELQLTQPKAEPVLHGLLRTEEGSFEAYGQKLTIEKGLINFTGPYDNPRIEFLALRPNNEDVRVGVSVTGTAQAPRIKLYADPDDKTESEKLSWLLLGRAPDELGRGDSALLQRAALALLSGDGKSRTGQVIKSLGLDELSVADSGGDARGTVVRLGKQLSKRWYVGYERSLATATGSWQLIYRIAQRFTLRGQSGDDNALDLIWQWKWD